MEQVGVVRDKKGGEERMKGASWNNGLHFGFIF